jgi:two-component sensor histidine kinase
MINCILQKTKRLSTKSYFSSLIDGIIEIFPKIIDLKIEKEIEDLSINEKTLSIVGIILNELITNSIKHAFVDRISGVISFCLSKINGKIKVIYKDNGVGMPESFFYR